MSYRNTWKKFNRHFGASFTSVGVQKPRYRCPRKFNELFIYDFFDDFLVFQDINISVSTPPTDMKFAPKCLFFQVLRYDIEFSFMGGTEENLKIKIYPTCFEKVFFRKNSLRGLQWYIFPLDILYGIGEKKRLQIFPTGRPP